MGFASRLKQLLSIEWAALLGLCVAALIAASNRVGFFFPDINAVSFTMSHYLGPMVPTLALPLLIATIHRMRNRHVHIEQVNQLMTRRARQCVALTLIVFIHFNFKLWAQLLNSERYDDLYHSWDLRWSSTVNVIEQINLFLVTVFRLWPNAYHDIFVIMFVVSLAAHAMQKATWIFDRVVLAIALVLVIGGLSYAIAPAWGPFVYGAGSNPFATEVQTHMIGFQRAFVESEGVNYSPEFFVAAVAAMPSLHIAHVFVLFWFASRYLPVLGFAYLVPSAFIFSEAIAARWHYLVDIPAGLAIAILCIVISNTVEPAKNGDDVPLSALD